MFHLMMLEIRKHKIRGFLWTVFAIIIGLCFFTTIAIYGSVQDNNNTVFPIFKLINAGILEVITIYSSVVMTKIVIEEYSKKTITIMFSYPVIREKLILSKLLLVCIYTMGCVIIANICCFFYLDIFDFFTDEIRGTVWDVNIKILINYALIGVFVSGFFSLIPFCVGMIRKSVSDTVVSSIGVVCLIQVIVSQTSSIKEYGFISLICCIIVFLFTAGIFVKKISDIDG